MPEPTPPEDWRGCPCLYTTPCAPDCTCRRPFSSRGCRRCCSYGSLAQQQAQAVRLAAASDGPVRAALQAYQAAVRQQDMTAIQAALAALDAALSSAATLDAPDA